MKLVVGLGNPGKQYVGTRHNIGFAIIEELIAQEGSQAKAKDKFQADIAELKLGDEQVICAMPSTYMNLSGSSVARIMQFYKLKREDLLVVHDDVHLDLGTLRVSLNRGAGGQNGVENIINSIGKDFYRLRYGVGPDPGGEERSDFVLGKFAKSDRDTMEEYIIRSVEAIRDWVPASEKELDLVVQKYNS